MKKVLLLLFGFVSFTMIGQEVKKEAAKTIEVVSEKKTEPYAIVEQQENGIYVFSFSKPAKKYRVIGKVNCSHSKTYVSFVDTLVEKAKKTYPTANGVIIAIDEQTGLLKNDFDVIEFIE